MYLWIAATATLDVGSQTVVESRGESQCNSEEVCITAVTSETGVKLLAGFYGHNALRNGMQLTSGGG